MANGYVGYVKKNGVVKCVSVDYGTDIDQLGIELNEYFKDILEVKSIIITSILSIEDGEVTYVDNLTDLTEDDYEFIEYENKETFIDEMESDTIYYLFEKDTWVVATHNCNEFKDLELVLEEEL